MLIKRVYNNNVVLVTRDDGNEAVLLGRSLGFNQKIGDRVDERLIEQVFLPSSSDASLAMASLLSETPLDWVRAANQIVEFAVHRLGLRNTQVLLLGIVDHLSFALQRAKQGIEMDFPLKWEVANLYPAELEAGREAVRLVNEHFGVVLDPNEAVAFALHFVNAGFTSEGLSRTVQMTKTITNLFRLFEETTGWIVDRDSMGAARFVTHLRYLFVRLSAQKQITTTPQPLLDAIVMVHGEAFTLANKMRYLIEMDFGGQLTDDEIAYLTLHVARLREDQRIGDETE